MIGKYTKIKKNNRKEEANMCTAATYQTIQIFIWAGRSDYEFSYGEEIAVMPSKLSACISAWMEKWSAHYAMIGMAHVADGLSALL